MQILSERRWAQFLVPCIIEPRKKVFPMTKSEAVKVFFFKSGLPIGLHRMCLWIVPGGGSLCGGIALFALSFIIGGVIGGFVLVWRLIVAVWSVPLTVYRLIAGKLYLIKGA